MLKTLGALWLLYMAWGLIRGRPEVSPSVEGPPENLGSITRHAALINLLNPKVGIFFSLSCLSLSVSGLGMLVLGMSVLGIRACGS